VLFERWLLRLHHADAPLQVRAAAEEVVKRFPHCAQAWALLSDAAAAAHGKSASVAVLREALNHCGGVCCFSLQL
jgi:hypothetical protein